MVKTSLTTYTIKAYSNRQTEDGKYPELNFDKLNDYTLLADTVTKFNTISKIFKKFFENEERHVKYDKKYLSIIKCNQEGENIFYGEFNYGNYDTEYDVINTNNNDKLIEKKITKDESVVSPYYFYFRFFKNRKDGLLILETKSNSGIKVILEYWLNKFLEEIRCAHFTIKLESFLPKEILNKFEEESHIRKIRYISYKLPSNKSDIYNEYEPEEGHQEYIVSIKKGKSKNHKNFLKKIFSKNEDIPKDLMKNVDFPVDDIKLELELEEEKRTFTIGNISKTRPIKDITYSLDVGDDGHRTFDSIHKIANNYAKDIIESDKS